METVKWTFENRNGEVAKDGEDLFTIESEKKTRELAVAFGASRLIGLDENGDIDEVIDLD